MKNFCRLFWKELKAQRWIFAAAVALAILPFVLAPLVDFGLPDSRADGATLASLLFLLAAPWALGAPWLTARPSGAGGEPPVPEGDWRLFASPLLARLVVVVLGACLPMAPDILASFRRESGEFGGSSPADIPEALALLTLFALSMFVFVQAGYFLVRDRSRRSLLDLAAILVFVGLLAIAASRLTGLAENDRKTLLVAFLCLWCLSGLFSAWQSFKNGPPIAQAHRRYSLSMIVSLPVLGAGAVLAACAVTAL